MVSPINYMLDVVNPMTAAMAGYSTGATERTNQQVTQQNMEFAATQEARAAERFQLEKAEMEEKRRANQAAIAEAAEAKRRGQAALDVLAEKGKFSEPIDYLNAAQANPDLAQYIQSYGEMVGAERLEGDTQLHKNLFVMLNKNPDAAKIMLEEQLAAARNANDPEAAALMESYAKMADSPEGQDGLRAMVGTALVEMVGKDAFTVLTNELGVGEEETTETVRSLEQRAERAGLVRGTPEYADFMQRGGSAEKGPLVQNIVGAGETEFAKTAGKEAATQLSAITNQGTTASRSLTELENLETLLANVETGGTAAVKEYLGGLGIATEGLGDIQAVNAAISRLVPQQRPPGSGTMSDADLVLFRKSLPSIINQPGGNQLIVETIRAINEYDVAASIIAGQALDLEITPAEARKRLRELPNPLADFKVPKAVTPPAEKVQKSTFMEQPKIKALAPEVREAAWQIYLKSVGQ